MDAYVRQAVQIAQRSNHKSHMHGCVIVSNEDGSVVSYGYNHTFPKRSMKETHSVHAEMHALGKFGAALRARYKNCSMVIVRIDKRAKYTKFSMPCSKCQQLILRCPCIRRVYYS